jgi:hypothetical protein
MFLRNIGISLNKTTLQPRRSTFHIHSCENLRSGIWNVVLGVIASRIVIGCLISEGPEDKRTTDAEYIPFHVFSLLLKTVLSSYQKARTT